MQRCRSPSYVRLQELFIHAVRPLSMAYVHVAVGATPVWGKKRGGWRVAVATTSRSIGNHPSFRPFWRSHNCPALLSLPSCYAASQPLAPPFVPLGASRRLPLRISALSLASQPLVIATQVAPTQWWPRPFARHHIGRGARRVLGGSARAVLWCCEPPTVADGGAAAAVGAGGVGDVGGGAPQPEAGRLGAGRAPRRR